MLDSKQREAVEWLDGPCLTLAGPGSGKTTVLVNRIIYLCSYHGVSANRILVITFTKDAAIEMRERFLRSKPADAGVIFGTFHSIFYNILKQEGCVRGAKLLTLKDTKRIFCEIGKLVQEDLSSDLRLEEVVKEISYVNNSSIPIEEYQSELFTRDKFIRIYKQYNLMKKEFSYIDFDDMLTMTFDLFKNNSHVLSKWQKAFDYILVDEAQDMNDLQFQTIKLMAKNNNLFLVGDDDQGIYGFRGANPKLMLDFPNNYSGCQIINLKTNYRSSKTIVSKAMNLINHNQYRFEKEVDSFSEDEGLVNTVLVESQEEEIQYLISQIQASLDSCCGKIAILFRNRIQASPIIGELLNNRINFYYKEKILNPYDHFVYKDIGAYLSLTLGDNKRSTLLQVINKPNRFISRNYFRNECFDFKELIELSAEKPWVCERIYQFSNDLKFIRKLSPFAAINYITNKMNYIQYLEESLEGNEEGFKEAKSNLDNLINISKQHKTIGEFLGFINKKRDLFFSQNQKSMLKEERVCLYTFHGSKGLEFDHVYIIDCNEGITPSKKAKDKDDIEEERRMFYVALTRAKYRADLITIKKKGSEMLIPSRFLAEMNDYSTNEAK